jgi:hypothetical protein
LGEFRPLVPSDTTAEEWESFLSETIEVLTIACRGVDPSSTDKALEDFQATDITRPA